MRKTGGGKVCTFMLLWCAICVTGTTAVGAETVLSIGSNIVMDGTPVVYPLSEKQLEIKAEAEGEIILRVINGLAYDEVIFEKKGRGTITTALLAKDPANYRVEVINTATGKKRSNIVDISELPDLDFLTIGGLPIPLQQSVPATRGWYEGNSLVCLYEFNASFPLPVEEQTVNVGCNFSVEKDIETGNILSGTIALDTTTIPAVQFGQIKANITALQVTVGQNAKIIDGKAAIRVAPFTFGPYDRGIVQDITIAGKGGELAYDIAKRKFSTDSVIEADGSARIGSVALGISVQGLTASINAVAPNTSYSSNNFAVKLSNVYAGGNFSLTDKKPVIDNFIFTTNLRAALSAQKEEMLVFTSAVKIDNIEGGKFNMNASIDQGKSLRRGRAEFVITEKAEAIATATFFAKDQSVKLEKFSGKAQVRLLGVNDDQVLATADLAFTPKGAQGTFTAINEPVFSAENFKIKVKKAYGGAGIDWSSSNMFYLEDAGVDFTMSIAKAVDIVINGLLNCSADYNSNTGNVSILVNSGLDFTFNPGKIKQTQLSLANICGEVTTDGNWKNIGVYLSGKLSLATNALQSTLEIEKGGIEIRKGKLVKFESGSDFYLETGGFFFKADGIRFDTQAKTFNIAAELEVDKIGYVATAIRFENKGLAIDDISFEVDHGLVKASCNGATFKKGTFTIDNLMLTIRKPAGEGVFCDAKMKMLFSQSGNGKSSYRYAYFSGQLESGAGVPLFNTGLMWTGGEVMAGYNTDTKGAPNRGSHAMGISGILRPVAANYVRILGGLELAYQPGSRLRTTIKGEVEVDFNNVVKAKGGLEAGYTWGYKRLDAAIYAGVKVPSNGSLLNINESRIDYALCKELPGGWTLTGRSNGTVLPKGFGVGFSGDFAYNGENSGRLSGSFWAEANKANTPNKWDYQKSKRILFWKAKLQARYWYEANLRGIGAMQFASKKVEGDLYLGGSANAGAQAQAWVGGERIGPISAQASAKVTGSNSDKAHFAYYNNDLNIDGKIKTGVNFSILGIRKKWNTEFNLKK